MGVRIEKIDLPGIGVRHDVLTSSGRRICVVAHRDGERDIALYDPDDPDAASDTIAMTDDEAAALADLLGASVTLSQLSGIRDTAAGVYTEQLSLPVDSPFIGRTLGDTRARSRTGVSIVAIVRGAEVVPSPTPREVFRTGDTVVAVGTRGGLDALGRILSGDKG